MNNYIISIDLNRLYNQVNNNLSNISDQNILKQLLDEYNSIDEFNFTNLSLKNNIIDNEINTETNIYIDDIIYKYNITESDLFPDKFNLINLFYKNPNKILSYNSGLILFDNSMVGDEELTNIINMVFGNYNDTIIDKIYNDYVIYFNQKINKAKQKIYDEKIFNEKINNLFIDDLKQNLLWSKIKNIPNVFQNDKLSKKLAFEFSYVGYIKENIYQNHYKKNKNNNYHKEITNYEKILYSDLSTNTNNYSINYNINLNEDTDLKYDLKGINNNNILDVLVKLQGYNNILNNISYQSISQQSYQSDSNQSISQQANQANQSDSNQSDSNQSDPNFKLLKIIKFDELFSIHKINNLFNFIIGETSKSNTSSNVNLNFMMDDILDDTISIYKNNTINTIINNNTNAINTIHNNIIINNKDLPINIFTNKIITFTNSLLKRKIVKVVRHYNYIQNKINIDNNN